MTAKYIVAVGGSAGAIESLPRFIKTFPADLSAAVFLVTHLPARGKSFLADLITRAGSLPAVDAFDGQRIEAGVVYVAQPDKHLIISDGHFHLTRGPKEGLHRPSINLTFRSAAAAYGHLAIGVVLSGMLDDGAAGLWDIAVHGGKTIVQDPEEAKFPGMPSNALQDLQVDHVLKLHDIGPTVARILSGDAMERSNGHSPPEKPRRFSGITCPECRGPLWESNVGPVEFECRVGHKFALKALAEEHTSAQERKMYEAILALQEGAEVADFLAKRTGGSRSEQFCSEAEQLRSHADAIRSMIEQRIVTPVD